MAVETHCRRRANRRSVASGKPKVGGCGQWQAGRQAGGWGVTRQTGFGRVGVA